MPLRETGWRRLDTGLMATREDLLRVLSSLETIEIRASHSYSMAYTAISSVAMTIAVREDTGRSEAVEVEECRCPEGHTGYSCEDCAPGYYKERTVGAGVCRKCPCSDNEESCVQQLSDNRVVCNCKPGFVGANCEIRGRVERFVAIVTR